MLCVNQSAPSEQLSGHVTSSSPDRLVLMSTSSLSHARAHTPRPGSERVTAGAVRPPGPHHPLQTDVAASCRRLLLRCCCPPPGCAPYVPHLLLCAHTHTLTRTADAPLQL